MSTSVNLVKLAYIQIPFNIKKSFHPIVISNYHGDMIFETFLYCCFVPSNSKMFLDKSDLALDFRLQSHGSTPMARIFKIQDKIFLSFSLNQLWDEPSKIAIPLIEKLIIYVICHVSSFFDYLKVPKCIDRFVALKCRALQFLPGILL